MSYFQGISDRFGTTNNNMNFARYSRQLFPLILGNSRIAQALVPSSRISLSASFSKEELDVKLNENPFYQKYAEKIQKLKQTNPKAYHEKIEALKRMQSKSTNADEKLSTDNRQEPRSTSQSQTDDKKRKGLDSIMKMELLENKSASEITEIWKDYYKDKDAVYAVISGTAYQSLNERRQANPVFIYPLPRKDGYEMLLGQFSGHDCHFTSLIHFQKYGENAAIQLVINHYTEYLESKGIVLMSGVPFGEELSVTDAQLLSYQMQYFYNEENYQIVKDFNQSPTNFEYNRIIECVSSSLLAQQRKSEKT